MASALVRLANYHTSQGDFEPAIGYARRWLALERRKIELNMALERREARKAKKSGGEEPAAPTEPDGELGLAYQGDLQQLEAMFRVIRDTLQDKEQIGIHPNL